MNTPEIHTGIHSYSIHMTQTAKQYYKILNALSPYRVEQNDYWKREEHITCNAFEKYGIKIYLAKINKIYSLKLRIEPCLVLGSKDPSALYTPGKSSYKELVKIVDDLLQPFHIPQSVDKMKICREDITTDLWFDSTLHVDNYIYVLKKGIILPHYKRLSFIEKEKKTKDCKAANAHSYKLQCKSAAFFAYDKMAQLQMTGRFPDTLPNKGILRLEAELKREALKKYLGKQSDNFHYLKAGAKKAEKVVRWYLKRIFPNTERHVRYEEAVMLINTVKGDKTRDRLQYILRKTSDSQSVSAAIEKTREKFNLSKGQMRRLLKKLEKLGISPITLPNAGNLEALPCLCDQI